MIGVAQGATPARDAGVEAAPLEPANILLVDDRSSNLRSLEAMLQQPGYNLVLARSGHEALAHVLRQEFVVILLDVAMPDMDGFETAAIIKERDQSRLIPIIFITASVYEMEQIFRGYQVGAVDYLRKPLDPHAVRAKVSVFVDLFRERRRNERQAKRLNEAERLLRERAEEALLESEAIYQTTFAEAPIGIGHASPAGIWTKTNRKLGEILGQSHDALVGRRVDEIVEEADAQTLNDAMARLRAGEPTVHAGEHRLRAARSFAWGHVTLSALHDVAGHVQRFIVVVSDISERKQVEIERARLVQELRHAVQARDDFLAIAAHELKTPITPLRLQTGGLLRELRRSAKNATPVDGLERRLETIESASARLETMVESLLDVSRISVGRMTIEREDVELVGLVEEMVAHLRHDIERSGSTVEVVSKEPIHGQWDRVRLGQLVVNLLSNAIKYGAGNPITVSATSDGTTARFLVRDHGIGIPPEAHRSIFERFERLAPVRHHGGFGLGLWIVREIATAHGGTVTVSSRLGEGAEFAVALPLAATASTAPAVQQALWTQQPPEVPL